MANNTDIIIPAYHAIEKLKKTIYSYGNDIKYHFIVVVDGDGLDYTPVINFFQDVQDIDIYYLEENQGPGMARNYGIDKATRQYITFIDSGDTVYNTFMYQNVLNLIYQHPEYYMVSCAHYEMKETQLEIVGPTHNRMHGKFFQRDFINKYNIRFSKECSRLNEDIGFNFAARGIAMALARQDNQDHILHLTDAIIVWENDPDSVTRVNNCAFYYQKNNEGLSKNGIHALNILNDNNIDEAYKNNIIYQILPSLYIFYYSCVFVRPEFKTEMEEGTKIFFKYLQDSNFKIDWRACLPDYNAQLKGVYSRPWDPFIEGLPDVSFKQWYMAHLLDN